MGKLKLILILLVFSSVLAQSIDEQFKQINGYEWAVETYEWGYISSAAKQRPQEVSNEVSREQAIEIANNFLKSNSKFFGVETLNYTDSAKILDIEKKYSWVIVYQGQMFEGLPILDTHTTVIMTSDGQIYAVGNLRYYFSEDEVITEGITEEEAVEAAKDYLDIESRPNFVNKIVKVDEDGTRQIIWNITFNCPVGEGVLVDQNSKIIEKHEFNCKEKPNYQFIFLISAALIAFFIVRKIRSKGILFGFSLVIVSLALISLLILQKSIYYKNYQKGFIENRINDMNNLYESIVFDLDKAVDIITKRAISTAISDIVTSGEPLNNPEEKIKELVFYGTINGQEKQLMQNSTIVDWSNRINYVGQSKNYNITISFLSLNIEQYDSFNLVARGSALINITDRNGVASINRVHNFSKTVSIEGFEDPLYVLSTEGKATKIIKKSKYLNNFTFVLFECSPSNNWAYGQIFYGYDYNQINQVGNKSQKILYLPNPYIADSNLVNQFLGVISPEDINYSVSIPFCENASVKYQISDGNNILLDAENGRVWYIDNILKYYNSGYYSPSLNGPSFLDRMEGKYFLSRGNSGIESFVDKDYFDSIDINVKDDTNIDYLYFNASYFSSNKIKGFPSSFKIDNQPSLNNTHLLYYGLHNLTI
ncbi:MAG: hypothetical protein QXM68_02440 [Candidatus Aenigmatarchaeota archaeon]|nr:hypothetical protein [Candidatus Aenigmarchaeota archaeon]